jgi:hypothetical protein
MVLQIVVITQRDMGIVAYSILGCVVMISSARSRVAGPLPRQEQLDAGQTLQNFRGSQMAVHPARNNAGTPNF